MHGFLVRGFEITVHQQLFSLQPDQGQRRLQFVRGFRRESPDLIECRFQSIEHLIQELRELGYFIADRSDRNTLAQVVRTDVVRRLADQAHGTHCQPAQAEADCDADGQHHGQHPYANFAVIMHRRAHIIERCRDGDVERAENEFPDSQLADAGKFRIELALPAHVRNGHTAQVRGIKDGSNRTAPVVHGDEK